MIMMIMMRILGTTDLDYDDDDNLMNNDDDYDDDEDIRYN